MAPSLCTWAGVGYKGQRVLPVAMQAGCRDAGWYNRNHMLVKCPISACLHGPIKVSVGSFDGARDWFPSSFPLIYVPAANLYVSGERPSNERS